VGVIVTVETPNVQRMATAVPVLALFPALVLDSLGRRVEMLFGGQQWQASGLGLAMRRATTPIAALVVLLLMFGQWQFYFVDYAAADRWPQPTNLGGAVKEQGKDTLVVTVGRQFHMVNSGWVRLLAPDTARGGVQAPGSYLPLAVPADRNLAFLVYPTQEYYLPYLSELYPGGVTTPYTHTTEGLMFTIYRVSQQQWAATQGAVAHPPDGPARRVATLGEAPAGWPKYPARMTWTAGLRVPQYWNYSFRIGPGPAKLTIDGSDVLTLPEGAPEKEADVALARGDHTIVLEGTVTQEGKPALVEWRPTPGSGVDPSPNKASWQPFHAEQLIAGQTTPRGLYGVVHVDEEKRAEQHRIDGTLADCCLTQQINPEGHPYTITWDGTLNAPVTGVYSMTLYSQGAIDLKLDNRSVIHIDDTNDATTGASVNLDAGLHPVEVTYHVTNSPGGIEWVWTPPDGAKSIVPPSALPPPIQSGVGPPLPPDALGKKILQPLDAPLDVVK
jgi:hypothetical protein